MDYADFANFLNERIRERGLSIKKLSELSGISLKHLENLVHANFENLPPSPYIRGYLMKLGRILDFDSNFWWENLREENYIKSSGARDLLPENRFAGKPASKYLWLSLALFVLIIYLSFRFSKIVGQPEITISNPQQNIITTKENTFLLIGQLKNGDRLFINGESINVDKNGYFQNNLNLQAGMNTIEITAKKFLGGENKTVRQIIYQPAASFTAPSSTAPF